MCQSDKYNELRVKSVTYKHINEVDCPHCEDGGFVYDEAQKLWFCCECFHPSPFIIDKSNFTLLVA